MRNLVYILLLGILFSSCFTFHNPELVGEEKFNFESVKDGTVKFTAGATFLNENWYGLKVKPSMMNLYIEDEFIGEVKLEKKVKLKSKRETALEAPFTLTLEKGAMLKMMRYATQGEIKVRLTGKVKGGVFIFSKKFEMDETKTISGASLKLGL